MGFEVSVLPLGRTASYELDCIPLSARSEQAANIIGAVSRPSASIRYLPTHQNLTDDPSGARSPSHSGTESSSGHLPCKRIETIADAVAIEEGVGDSGALAAIADNLPTPIVSRQGKFASDSPPVVYFFRSG
jgi:hypothetical protein